MPRAIELEPSLGWINSPGPLRFDGDLAGRVVALFFYNAWRIESLQSVSDIAWLQSRFGMKGFVVVGVHGARFPAEADVDAVRDQNEAIGLGVPVVVDRNFRIWRRYGIERWPTFVLIDARGEIVGSADGVGNRRILERYIADLVEAAPRSVPFHVEVTAPYETALRLPGGVEAFHSRVGRAGHLFVADTAGHRVIHATQPDAAGRAEVVAVFGDERGFADGVASKASFNGPRGLAFDDRAGRLFVADSGNHAVREIDIAGRAVSTFVGTGKPGDDLRGGRAASEQPLNCPWDVVIDRRLKRLYVTMAGSHQLWQVERQTRVATRLAGVGGEGVVDGAAEHCRFAQPAGIDIGSDGRYIYIVDGQGCAIRRFDLVDRELVTLVGVSGEQDVKGIAGDVDGMDGAARLQRPAGVCVWARAMLNASGDELLVTDAHNGKLKRVATGDRKVEAWASGDGAFVGAEAIAMAAPAPGEGHTAQVFVADTRKHQVTRIDTESGERTVIEFVGLEPSAGGR